MHAIALIVFVIFAVSVIGFFAETFGFEVLWASLSNSAATAWTHFKERADVLYQEKGVPFARRMTFHMIAINVIGTIGAFVLALQLKSGQSTVIGVTVLSGMVTSAWMAIMATRKPENFRMFSLAIANVGGLLVNGMVIATIAAWAGDQTTMDDPNIRLVIHSIAFVGTLLALAGLVLTKVFASLASYIATTGLGTFERLLDMSLSAIAISVKAPEEQVETIRARMKELTNITPDEKIGPWMAQAENGIKLYLLPYLSFALGTISLKFTFMIMCVAALAVGMMWMSLAAMGIDTKKWTVNSLRLANVVVTTMVIVTLLELILGKDFTTQVGKFWGSVGSTLASALQLVNLAMTVYLWLTATVVICIVLAFVTYRVGEKLDVKKVSVPFLGVFALTGFVAFLALMWNLSEARALGALNQANWLPRETMSLKPTAVDVPTSHVLVTWQALDYAGTYRGYRIERRSSYQTEYTIVSDKLVNGVTTFEDHTLVPSKVNLISETFYYRLVGKTATGGLVPGREIEVSHQFIVTQRPSVPPPPNGSASTPTRPASCTGPACAGVVRRSAALCKRLGGHC